MPLPLQVAFVAGSSGIWRIERITAVAGESLPPAERLAVIEGPEAQRPPEGSWILRGTTSNSRYTNREELMALSVKQEMLLKTASDARRAHSDPEDSSLVGLSAR
jgi:hypothetical protein